MKPLHPLLAKRVAAIDVVEVRGGSALVLPSPAAVLGIQFRGRVRSGDTLLTRAGITGVQTTARTYDYDEDTASVFVRFTPQGAASLGVPASELASRSVGLADFLPRARVGELLERLDGAAENATRISLVEQFLAEFADAGDALVNRALARLDAQPDVAIARLAKDAGVSERQLERRFLARVGVTPQRYVSLRRFQRAVALAATAPTLAAAAHQAGYADQSHFNREFRRYVQRAPGEVLRAK